MANEKKRRRTSGAATAVPLPLDPVAGLAASIGHDFSNLLMIIRNAAEFLKEDLPRDNPSRAYVDQLLQASFRAASLVKQLQAFGRAQLLKPERVRASQVVRGMADTLRHVVPEDVEFRVSIRCGDACIVFDVSQLQVAIFNLIAVASELLRTRGRLQLAVRRETLAGVQIGNETLSGDYVTILVSASGAMLESSDLTRAFQPRLTGKLLPRGTDLRLASVYGIVTQSGGHLHASIERGDVAFRAYLPVVAPEDEDAPAPKLRVYRDLTGDEVVFVVEDDAAVRGMVRDSLERYGYTVYEAADGAEALHLAELFNRPPDLLLTDLVMPAVTGRELVEGLRNEGRLPKVLLMSGYTDDDVLRRSRPSDQFPFIKKPFTHRELALKVREVLEVEPDAS